jgi:hypothetical protein
MGPHLARRSRRPWTICQPSMRHGANFTFRGNPVPLLARDHTFIRGGSDVAGRNPNVAIASVGKCPLRLVCRALVYELGPRRRPTAAWAQYDNDPLLDVSPESSSANQCECRETGLRSGVDARAGAYCAGSMRSGVARGSNLQSDFPALVLVGTQNLAASLDAHPLNPPADQ